MKFIAVLGFIAFQVYKAVVYIANFIACFAVIIASFYLVNILAEGWKEARLDRKSRAFKRDAETVAS